MNGFLVLPPNLFATGGSLMKKYKKGYTTGVFDLFHIGHLNILRHAKEKCDYLIVGVSTDEVVRFYKGKTPVIPFEERILIVQAIKYVDEVVPQMSMDKFEAWGELRFDAIFHGDDWKGSKMYEEIEKKLTSVGVDVVYFPYTKGTSSTILADALAHILDKQKVVASKE
jgi:glycerol-3-phosphate cytidylyltransferase